MHAITSKSSSLRRKHTMAISYQIKSLILGIEQRLYIDIYI